jgi:hypothetical protein
LRTAPEGSFSAVAVEGLFTSSCPVKVAGPVVASAFDEPIALKTGFRLGASEAEAAVEVGIFMGFISLLACEDLDLRVPPVSLVSCFISLSRCEYRNQPELRKVLMEFTAMRRANHAVGVVVGRFVGLELVHARVAFPAHFACRIAISRVIGIKFERVSRYGSYRRKTCVRLLHSP